jgi:hypothetical protein
MNSGQGTTNWEDADNSDNGVYLQHSRVSLHTIQETLGGLYNMVQLAGASSNVLQNILKSENVFTLMV